MVAVRSEEMNFGRAKGGGSALFSLSLSIQTGPTVLLPSLPPSSLASTHMEEEEEEGELVCLERLARSARQADEGDDLGRLGRLRLVGAGGGPRLPTKDEGWQQLPLYGGRAEEGGRRWCPAMPDT